MTSIFTYTHRMRCGCLATIRQTFDGAEIQSEHLTPSHDSLVDQYRATPPWKRDGMVDPCALAEGA